jgi:tRNA (guanine37-N1)-methyltransferase
MWLGIVSLFPEMFQALNHGITSRAQEKKLITLNYWNPRAFTHDSHRTVDDRPYGGGPGMVMMVEPLRAAIHTAKKSTELKPTVIYLSPQGRLLTQAAIQTLAKRPAMVLVSGRYEGVDERLLETEIDEEWSIGDYVLSGGELAAMVLIDAVTRLLPGALGHHESAQQDSFMQGLLDFPHFTRPEEIDERRVPSVLTSGDHQAIARWRLKQALGRTWLRRPELLKQRELTPTEATLLEEFIKEHQKS